VTIQELLEKVEKKRRRYQLGGGSQAIERQHSLGKRTAAKGWPCFMTRELFRKRIYSSSPSGPGLILMKGAARDAVVIGIGKVNGARLQLYTRLYGLGRGHVHGPES